MVRPWCCHGETMDDNKLIYWGEHQTGAWFGIRNPSHTGNLCFGQHIEITVIHKFHSTKFRSIVWDSNTSPCSCSLIGPVTTCSCSLFVPIQPGDGSSSVDGVPMAPQWLELSMWETTYLYGRKHPLILISCDESIHKMMVDYALCSAHWLHPQRCEVSNHLRYTVHLFLEQRTLTSPDGLN